jgi:hypothetical protein
MTFDEILTATQSEGAMLYRPATDEDIQQAQKDMKMQGYPSIPQGYCEFLKKHNGYSWSIPGEITMMFFTVHRVAEKETTSRPQSVADATGQFVRGADGDDLRGKKNYISLASLIAGHGQCVYNTANNRYEVLKYQSCEAAASFDTFEELFIHVVLPRFRKLGEYKANRVMNALEKVEADGWVFFKYHTGNGYAGLFKARADGSDLTCIAEPSGRFWSELRNIKAEDGWIYFDVTEEYSERNDDAYEFDRYRDQVTYRIKPDGTGREDVTRSSGYLNSSD